MMSGKLILIGVFLPLFPLSMVFNVLFRRIRLAPLRIAVLITWPLVGLWLIDSLQPALDTGVVDWLLPWAILTSVLYALRLLVLRELNHWTAFLATSLWALLWVPVSQGVSFNQLLLDALGFSLPLVLLVFLALQFTLRYGAAYSELYNGIAENLPRLSTILVLSVLAAIGTPLFPSFFSMLSFLLLASPLTASGLLLIWLLWSWSGVRILQGFIVGTASGDSDVQDIGIVLGSMLLLALLALLALGAGLIGGRL
jgi:hypothetical protein